MSERVHKNTSYLNGKSTVGTMTELNDHLKLLFARAATLYCRGCGKLRCNCSSLVFIVPKMTTFLNMRPPYLSFSHVHKFIFNFHLHCQVSYQETYVKKLTRACVILDYFRFRRLHFGNTISPPGAVVKRPLPYIHPGAYRHSPTQR